MSEKQNMTKDRSFFDKLASVTELTNSNGTLSWY
jgi:hypothetical protein